MKSCLVPAAPTCRPPALRALGREAAFALAFLAVWMLALLTPLHQVSRLGGDLRAAGVRGLSDWTLCLPGGAPEAEGPAPLLCPAQAVAHALDAPPAETGFRAPALRSFELFLPPLPRAAPLRMRRGRKQPRAPPVRARVPPAFPFAKRDS